MTCTKCNSWTETGAGGLSVSGAAQVSDTIIRGGVAVGGTASVDIAGDVFDGLQAVWLLGEDFTDATENNYDGTAGDGVAAFTPTQIQSLGCLDAREFAGRQFVRVPVANKEVRSISCWLRIDSFFEERTVFSRPGFRLAFTVLRQPYLQVSDGEATDTAYASTSLENDKWYHIAATWKPDEAILIYINGEESGSATTTVATLDSGSVAWIGRLGQASFPQCGMMDFRLYPDARSADWWAAEHEGICPGLIESEGEIEEVTYE